MTEPDQTADADTADDAPMPEVVDFAPGSDGPSLPPADPAGYPPDAEPLDL